MKTERSDVNFPVWRKKVDTTLLKNGCTPIPAWVMKIWDIELLFDQSFSKKAKDAAVTIMFGKETYPGYVTRSLTGESSLYRLFTSKELRETLKSTYVMSYMRTLEGEQRKIKSYKAATEKDLPFWEFLDIEFDSNKREFFFTAYYLQKPIFPELFRSLIKSTVIKQFESDNELEFIKSDWIPREELASQMDVANVIYYLIDTRQKHFYIGEAEKMIRRFEQGHLGMKTWNYFRYDQLPDGFSKKQRVALERMLIRCFASILSNNKGIPTQNISDYKLTNLKIDF